MNVPLIVFIKGPKRAFSIFIIIIIIIFVGRQMAENILKKRDEPKKHTRGLSLI